MADADKQSKPTEWLRRVSRNVNARADASRKILGDSSQVVRSSTSRIIQMSGSVSETLVESTAEAAELLRSMPGRALERLIQEAPVPVFLLPTGSQADDFRLVFDFHQVLEQLRSGILVRPVIQLYTGREDFDRTYFADHLKEEFVRQFHLAKEKERLDYEADVEEFESKRTTAKEEMTGPLGWVGGILLQHAFSDPTGMTGLILLALFVHKGKRAFGPLMEYLDLTTKMRTREKELGSRLRGLDKKFDSKNKTFQRAVNNIDVAVHPRIQTLVELICEVDGVVSAPLDPIVFATDCPDITKFLNTSEYIEALPSEYRPLLDVIDVI